MSAEEAIQIVSVVLAVEEAEKRVPAKLRSYTFFGDDDMWLYFAVVDDVTCEPCMQYEVGKTFIGAELLALFPYLDILDADWINVNIHPNCRCHLRRISDLGVEF